MSVQDSFSRLKKKVKRLGNKRKPDRIGADTGGESVNQGNPLPQPEPHLVAGDGEGNGADAEGWRACSSDRPPQPDEPWPVPASGNEDGEGRGEASTYGREDSQRDSHLYPDVEVVAGSGPSQEGNRANRENVYRHSSTPPIPYNGKTDSM